MRVFKDKRGMERTTVENMQKAIKGIWTKCMFKKIKDLLLVS